MKRGECDLLCASSMIFNHIDFLPYSRLVSSSEQTNIWHDMCIDRWNSISSEANGDRLVLTVMNDASAAVNHHENSKMVETCD